MRITKFKWKWIKFWGRWFKFVDTDNKKEFILYHRRIFDVNKWDEFLKGDNGN